MVKKSIRRKTTTKSRYKRKLKNTSRRSTRKKSNKKIPKHLLRELKYPQQPSEYMYNEFVQDIRDNNREKINKTKEKLKLHLRYMTDRERKRFKKILSRF